MNLNEHLRENIKLKLYNLKDEFEREIKRIEELGLRESLKDITGELSSYDNHSSDLGSETFERGKDIALRDRQKILLKKVIDALDKLETGKYGYCEHCEEAINEERLEAVPYTTLCLKCQEKIEKSSYNSKRPIEEKVISPPFVRSFRNGSDYTGYDGEDTWQDVAKYGNANSPQDEGGLFSYKDVYIDSEDKGTVEEVEKITEEDIL